MIYKAKDIKGINLEGSTPFKENLLYLNASRYTSENGFEYIFNINVEQCAIENSGFYVLLSKFIENHFNIKDPDNFILWNNNVGISLSAKRENSQWKYYLSLVLSNSGDKLCFRDSNNSYCIIPVEPTNEESKIIKKKIREIDFEIENGNGELLSVSWYIKFVTLLSNMVQYRKKGEKQ